MVSFAIVTHPAEPNVPAWLLLSMVVALGSFLLAWAAVLLRWREGQPVIAYQGRKPVPWGGLDLLLLTALWMGLGAASARLAATLLGWQAVAGAASYRPEQLSSEHLIVKLLAAGDPWLWFLCAVTAVVIAPVAEELFFRVMLQGWLEGIEQRLRPRLPTLRCVVPRGLVPVLISSELFALSHFRVLGPPRPLSYYVYQVAATVVIGLVMVVATILWLHFRAQATAVDLGWVPERVGEDVGLGLLAFAALAAPVYALQYGCSQLLPSGFAADPIPLYLLALGLGTLYHRTHRVVPSIVLHMALNGTSLSMAYWSG